MPDSIDSWARAIGLLGTGCMFGCTYATSSVVIPTILQPSASSNAPATLSLFARQFDTFVARCLPLGLIGGASFLLAGVRTRTRSGLPSKASSRSSSSPGLSSVLGAPGTPLLLAGASMVALLPYTLALVLPSVRRLKALLACVQSGGPAPSSGEVRELVQVWEGRHRGRILLAGVSFGLGVWEVVSGG